MTTSYMMIQKKLSQINRLSAQKSINPSFFIGYFFDYLNHNYITNLTDKVSFQTYQQFLLFINSFCDFVLEDLDDERPLSK